MGLTRPRAHQLQDATFKQTCRAISTSNTTLSGGAPATVDGVSLTVGDRVLVTGQTTGSENGLYRVTTVGTGSNGTWVRTADGDETGDITAGMTIMVTEGSTNADTMWKLTTDDPITVGTTALSFEQFGGGGSGDPAGANTQVQFNDAGSFAGDAGLTYNKTTDALTVVGTVDMGTLSIGSTAVTATAAELNKLDGVTATTTELNYVDGVTSSIQTQLNAKGTVSSLSDLSITATAAELNKLDGVTATTTELNYVDGVTSSIQTQLNAKQATITGAATTIDTENLTASRALVSDGSGKVAVSAVTSTEVGYLDGVTSAIQTQLNAKLESLAFNSLTSKTSGTGDYKTTGDFITAGGTVSAIVSGDGSGSVSLTTNDGYGNANLCFNHKNGTPDTSGSSGRIECNVDSASGASMSFELKSGTTSGTPVSLTTIMTLSESAITAGSGIIFSGTATAARYADLAEKYVTDQAYEPGTVVVVGGEKEATESTTANDHKVLGIISTAPALMMNSESDGQYVALTGRVPCKVVGDIQRGDLLVTSDVSGHAKAWNPGDYLPGTIIGKALEAHEGSDPGVIEVVVGRH